jgi:hypothetical protein
MIEMNKKLNAIVLAGTHGAKPFEIDGKMIFKQYIEICGKTIVERIVDTTLESRLIDKVYVVGNSDELEVHLGSKPKDRCVIVEQGENIAENVLGTFTRYVVPDILNGYRERCQLNELIDRYWAICDEKVFIITADVLFPSVDSIEKLILKCDDEAEVQYGVTSREVLQEFLKRYGLNDYDENLFKTTFIPAGRRKLRLNNMCVAKPLRIPTAARNLSELWYENRVFIDDAGRSRREMWTTFASKIRKYVNDSSGKSVLKRIIRYRGLLNALLIGAVLYVAINRGKGSRLADLRDGERTIAWLTGIDVKFRITESLSVIDLDKPDLYYYFRKKGVFDKVYLSQ